MRTSTQRRLDESADSGSSSGGGRGGGLRGLLACCCGADVVEDVVNAAEMTARSLSAAPPLELTAGYANEDGVARGMAPPERGIFEVVNKSKFANEIIAVLVSSNAADVALRRPPGSSAQLACLRQGLMPAQTVLHGLIGDDVEAIEVALFYGCMQTSTMAVRAAAGGDGLISDSFRHVKAYRIRCKGKNVLLKYKDGGPGGGGLEIQKGEAGGLAAVTGKKKRSVGGGIDMKTNVLSLELVQ